MERKDIKFGVEKIDHKWYFHFDTNTGIVNSMSVNKENSSIEIPSQLALNIQSGVDNMAFYKVVFENGAYRYINTVQAITEVSEEKNYKNENTNFYKIPDVLQDSQIVLTHKADKIFIGATQQMKNIIADTFDRTHTNSHKFYVCQKNDHSILHQLLDVDLNDLVDNELEFDVGLEKSQCSVYCRKVFDYCYV